jgi:preprotein translocase YajC subunit
MNIFKLLAESTKTPWYQDPSLYIMLLLVVVLGAMILLSSRRRKSAQQKAEQMLDTLRPGNRVRTVGGVVGRIKEIREESPGMKTVLLQTGNDKYPSFMLFDINAIFGIFPEEGHTIDGAPVLKPREPQTETLINGEVVSEGKSTEFDAKAYVEKSIKAKKK